MGGPVSTHGQSPLTGEVGVTASPPKGRTGVRVCLFWRQQYRMLPTFMKWIFAILLFFVAFYAAVLILWEVERHVLLPIEAARPPTAASRPHFWIQVFAGKWTANTVPYASTTFAFAHSVIWALVLNLGPFAATLTLIYLYLIRPLIRIGKEQTMKLQQYNNQRDQVIIGEIWKRLPPENRESIIKIVEEGFEYGGKAMDNEFLAIPYSERGAREFVKRLNEIDVT
jgi:hypothetical protein